MTVSTSRRLTGLRHASVSVFCDSGPMRLNQQRWTLRRLMESQPWMATRERPGVLLDAPWKIFVLVIIGYLAACFWHKLIVIFCQSRSTSCQLEWTKQDLHSSPTVPSASLVNHVLIERPCPDCSAIQWKVLLAQPEYIHNTCFFPSCGTRQQGINEIQWILVTNFHNEVEKSLAKEATKDSNCLHFIVETRFESKRTDGTEIPNGDHDQESRETFICMRGHAKKKISMRRKTT